ncbi:o-succinylbenzoate synthase [Rhodoluna sp.]|uniref:o-succinylbenzoate synthase n=1 Tax=Rhodoluna sp. TaxID=1969481 RepID=UPI0025E9E97B|nr:o-succinylbenzoate synthase [Rhodoluna sp.]
MKLEAVELIRLNVPLKSAFRTSFSSVNMHEVVWAHAVTDVGEGWAECGANDRPDYSSEYHTGAMAVLREFMLPDLFKLNNDLTAESVAPTLEWIKGHRMAKAAIETSLLDAQLRSTNTSFASYLGATKDRVPAGVSVGIMDSLDELMEYVHSYLDQGYMRIKLKIEPGWDYDPVKLVRETFGPDLLLQVDANTAYTRNDFDLLKRLDEFNLLLIEQPINEEDMLGHAKLADYIETPVCLDETIISADIARDAIELGAAEIINIKPSRVGGYLESKKIHDVSVAAGIPVWCGGMLETGIGRAANLALAAMPGFTLPGDTSASSRYFETDTTEPFVLVDGHITVPTGPGIGVDPIPEIVDRYAVSREWIKA